MGAVGISVLGPLTITTAGHTSTIGRNQRGQILAALLCQMGQPISIDVLAEELGTHRQNVMKAKAKLALDLQKAGVDPDAVLASEPDGCYRVLIENLSIDARSFDEALQEAEVAVGTDASKALYLVTAALKLWGSPFQGVPSTPSIDDEAVRLEGLHRRALHVRCAALLGTGQVMVAETEARSMLRTDPDDEAACHLLVVALGRLGRQFDALDELQRLNDIRAERGTEPSAALLALQDQIVRGEISYEPDHLENLTAESAVDPVPTRVRVNTRTNLVGQRDLLDRLDRALGKAGGGRPAVCWIEGAAGFGKTRLIEEWASGASVAPFEPCWLEFRQDDDGAFRRHAQVLMDALDLDAPGTELADADLFQELVDQRLVNALIESAGSRPMLLVIEDLHWADTRSLGFLDRLVVALNRHRASLPCPLMVVMTSRPELDDEAQSIVDRIRRGRVVSWLNVEALHELEVNELLIALGVSEPASSMLSTVRTVTAGNPLAIRTLLMRLDQTRALARLHDQTIITEDDADIRRFSGLDAIVESHVSASSEECRRVLMTAAVLGKHAHRHHVDDLIDDTDAVELGIAEAMRGGFLVTDDESSFRFAHPVIAQVALADGRASDIQELHAGAAKLMMAEDVPDPDAITAIADHLVRAGPLADDRALTDWCGRAGTLALEVAAWGDANRYLSAALDAAGRAGISGGGLAALRLVAATAAFRDHQIGVAAALFREVADFGHRTGDADLRAQGLVELARCLAHNPIDGELEEPYEELLEFLMSADGSFEVAPSTLARAHQQLATLAWSNLDFDAALHHANRSLEFASVETHPLVVAQASLMRGLALVSTLRLPESLQAFDLASSAAATVSVATFHHWGLSRAALTNWALGRFDVAYAQAQEAAVAAERASNWAEDCLATTILAGTSAAGGDLRDAARHAEHANRLFQRSAFYWAGSLLLPIRIELMASGWLDATVDEIVEDWNRPLPLSDRIRIAIDHGSAAEQRALLDDLDLAQSIAEVTIANLPDIVAAAELAVELEDAWNAAEFIPSLQTAVDAGVVVVPGQNRRIRPVLAACESLAGSD